jgi:hypothetical protein
MDELDDSWGDQSIPLGGGLSSHAVRRRRWRRRYPTWPLVAVVLGAAAALAGVLLATTAEPQALVVMDGTGYTVAGERLMAQGGGVYQASSGAALVVTSRGGRSLAGGSAVLDGRPMAGRCELDTPPDAETCTFTVAGGSLSARDERTSYGWHRRYSDGRTVAIHLSGDRAAPVPFVVGR